MMKNPSFDITTRNLIFNQKNLTLTYLNSLSEATMISELVKGINAGGTIIDVSLANGSVEENNDIDALQKALYSGCAIIEYENRSYIVDTRSYPSSSIQQPETEKTVRGSKDGFNENIIVNVGLIRRRIRDTNLVMELHTVGKVSKCDVCVSYLSNKVNQDLLQSVMNRLQSITIDDLSMSDRALEELFIKQGYHPFPFVRYCERPDIVATQIMKGYIAIIVDTSSSVILLPVTLFELLEHVEEHRQNPIVGSLLRLIRLFGVMISVYLIPIWLVIIKTPELEWYILKNPTKNLDYGDIVLQIIILEFAIELLRVATIHTPSALSNSISLVSALLLGEIAVGIGIFLEEVLLYGAISTLASFATPNYELSLANKLVKWLLIIAIMCFNQYGFVVMNFLLFIYLANLKVFNKEYLYPFVPFDDTKFLEHLIRKPKKENSSN